MSDFVHRIRGIFPVNAPPIRCGIYFLVEGSEVVYVGQSVNILSRVFQHLEERKKQFDSIFAVDVDKRRLDVVEGAFIRHLRPRFNKTHGYKTNEVDEEIIDEYTGNDAARWVSKRWWIALSDAFGKIGRDYYGLCTKRTKLREELSLVESKLRAVAR